MVQSLLSKVAFASAVVIGLSLHLRELSLQPCDLLLAHEQDGAEVVLPVDLLGVLVLGVVGVVDALGDGDLGEVAQEDEVLRHDLGLALRLLLLLLLFHLEVETNDC